jgi:hypothetical protein
MDKISLSFGGDDIGESTHWSSSIFSFNIDYS